MKEEFIKLAREWQKETSHLQLVNRVDHEAYVKILEMGPDVVPFILEDMKTTPDHWMAALYVLTGANPIPPDFSGTISDAIQLWIEWGCENSLTD